MDNHLDNAIDKANETLESLLGGLCSFFVTKVEDIKEKKEQAKQEEALNASQGIEERIKPS